MTEYKLFASEERRYNLGYPNLSRAWAISKDFLDGLIAAERTDEAIATILSGVGYESRSERFPQSVARTGIFWGNLTLKTELLYLQEGRLMVGVIDVDEHDQRLSEPISLHNLATFRENGDRIYLNVHPLHQMGIDPTFLYSLGEKHQVD